MAHFAQIDADNIVVQVLVVPDEQEHRGEEFLRDDLQLGGRWIQTSYNGTIRRRFAGAGYDYDETRDVFIAPKPFPSAILNDNFDWVHPVPKPADANQSTYWDEPTLSWITQNDLPV